MIGSSGGDVTPRKLLSGRAVKIKIALASILVLTIGALLAPRAARTGLSAPQERAAPLLEEQVQLRETSRPFTGVQDIAALVTQHSVAILAPAAPEIPTRNDYSESAGSPRPVTGFGVFVSGSHVLTHSAALDGRSAAEIAVGNGPSASADVVSYEPSTGLVLLQLPLADGRTSATIAASPPAPGALAVAVGRSGEREIAIPVFVTSAGREDLTIGAVDDRLLPGMPVFNLAGEVFAIAAPYDGEVRAIPVRRAAERMLARASTGERRSSMGLAFQTPTGALTTAFGNEGVIISEVVPGGPADAADIRVADVLLAVGDVQIDSAETAARTLSRAAIGTSLTLRVRRGARVLQIDATPALAYEVAALARSNPGAFQGLEARVLFPAAVLDASAIAPSARVVSVNGRTVTTRTQVQRELRSASRPIAVLLREGNRQFFVAVQPSR